MEAKRYEQKVRMFFNEPGFLKRTSYLLRLPRTQRIANESSWKAQNNLPTNGSARTIQALGTRKT